MNEIQQFYNMCRKEVEDGGYYLVRIRTSELYMSLVNKYSNLDAIILKAESKGTTTGPLVDKIREIVISCSKTFDEDDIADFVEFALTARGREAKELMIRYKMMSGGLKPFQDLCRRIFRENPERINPKEIR